MAFLNGVSRAQGKMRRLPEHLTKVLRGAGREGGKVFRAYVEAETPSQEVRDGLRLRTKLEDGYIKTTLDVKPGWARSVANWLEWGTEGHFISVDDSVRKGRSVARINQQSREPDANSSLVIGGNFVGKTVWHPGANPHPTFRPARDLKASEARAAAQSYINAHVGKFGTVGQVEGDDE